jgi:hypothetical protein
LFPFEVTRLTAQAAHPRSGTSRTVGTLSDTLIIPGDRSTKSAAESAEKPSIIAKRQFLARLSAQEALDDGRKDGSTQWSAVSHD